MRTGKALLIILIQVFVVFLVIFPVFAENSQESKPPVKKEHKRNFANYANIGFSGLNNLSGVNGSLEATGYKAFEGTFLTVGTGTRSITGNFIFGAESNFVLEQKHLNTNNFKSYLSYTGNALANVGYVIFSAGEFRIYPLIGGGFGNLRMDFFENEAGTDFKQVLATPKRGSSLSSFGVLADLGMAVDYTFDIGKSEEKHGGFMFGLRGGYIFTLYQTGFSIKDTDVQDMPEINFNGPYIRVFIGVTNDIFSALLDVL